MRRILLIGLVSRLSQAGALLGCDGISELRAMVRLDSGRYAPLRQDAGGKPRGKGKLTKDWQR